MKIDGQKFKEFVAASDEVAKKIIAAELLNALAGLDSLPKKVNDFDKDRFKQDVRLFFKEQDIGNHRFYC